MLGRKKAQVFNKKFLCSILENGIFIKPLKYNFFFLYSDSIFELLKKA